MNMNSITLYLEWPNYIYCAIELSGDRKLPHRDLGAHKNHIVFFMAWQIENYYHLMIYILRCAVYTNMNIFKADDEIEILVEKRKCRSHSRKNIASCRSTEKYI